MKKENLHFQTINSISAFHRLLGLPLPNHPLISVVDLSDIRNLDGVTAKPTSYAFFIISIKKFVNGKIKYGQEYYDFDAGTMSFIAPRQTTIVELTDVNPISSGLQLSFHPDFIRSHPLGRTIHSYGFFSYGINEALHLSDKEERIIKNVFGAIREELDTSIDEVSQDVATAYIEVLLNYAKRFYRRQFITRKAVNSELLTQIEQLLEKYFDSKDPLLNGLPTVEYLASQLYLSPRYLSDVLRSLTGQNAQQHIHGKLIEKAKEKLSSSNLTISEIAYELGFEHPQSFSKLFKNKTNASPLAYRKLFN